MTLIVDLSEQTLAARRRPKQNCPTIWHTLHEALPRPIIYQQLCALHLRAHRRFCYSKFWVCLRSAVDRRSFTSTWHDQLATAAFLCSCYAFITRHVWVFATSQMDAKLVPRVDLCNVALNFLGNCCLLLSLSWSAQQLSPSCYTYRVANSFVLSGHPTCCHNAQAFDSTISVDQQLRPPSCADFCHSYWLGDPRLHPCCTL